MSLNCCELECIVNELKDSYIVKGVTQTENDILRVHLLNNDNEKTLEASVCDTMNYIAITGEKYNIKKGRSLRFGQFLNSTIAGCKVEYLKQYKYSRIVDIRLKGLDSTYHLFFRLWNTGSNIILTDENSVIIDTLRRMSQRGEWPGEVFEYPAGMGAEEAEEKFPVREAFQPISSRIVREHYFTMYKTRKIDQKKSSILKKIDLLQKKHQTRLTSLNLEIQSDKFDELLEKAELLKANIYRIKKGMTEIELDDYCGNIVKFRLKKDLSPIENVQNYFKKYKKVKDSKGIKEKMIHDETSIIDEIISLREEVESAVSISDIDSAEKSAQELFPRTFKSQVNKQGMVKKRPGRKFSLSDGFIAYVSKSSKDADQLLKKTASGNDWWFHIRDYEGSHVIVKNKNNKTLSENARLQAALLALMYSKSSKAKEGDIYFTQVKYLHKPNTGTPGLVFPTKEKNIHIVRDEKISEKIVKSIEN